MDVTIYYTERYKEAPSAVERITTPLESAFDRWRVHFCEVCQEPVRWCLMMEKWGKSEDGEFSWLHYPDYLPISVECGNMADYMDWLGENVSIVEVDGRPFWVNPTIGDEK